MVGGNNLPRGGFDEPSFRQKVEGVLGEGLAAMIENVRSNERVWGIYEDMDIRLAVIVRDTGATADAADWARKMTVETLQSFRKAADERGVDTSKNWNSEIARVSVIILKAIGQMDNSVIHLDKLKEAAINAMTQRANFDREGAEMLIDELSPLGCKDLHSLLMRLDDSPNSMEFIRFIERNGTRQAIDMASKAGFLALPRERKMMHAPINDSPIKPPERLRR